MSFGLTRGLQGQEKVGIKTLSARHRVAGRRRRGEGAEGGEGGAAARVEELETRLLLAEIADTMGREFWVAFEQNSGGAGEGSLMLSARQQAQVRVEVPGIAWTQDCTVIPGVATTVNVPAEACALQEDGTAAVGIHITSDQEIAVYGMSYVLQSADGFTGLPVDVLGNSYMAIAYPPSIDDASVIGSQFAVVATEDGTSVTITPSVDAGTRSAGDAYVITLHQGEVYQLQSRGSGAGHDLSGSLITADRPVAVFSGDTTTNVPVGVSANDHLVEQLIPIPDWGDHFITVPLAARNNGDTFRVLAADGGTELRVNDVLVKTLSGGECYEWISAVAQEIRTSKPVTLAQYANSSMFDSAVGDPFMAIIPPVELSLTDYTMQTPILPAFTHPENFINIWAKEGTSVVLDGKVIPNAAFTPVGNSGYVTASKEQIGLGNHTVSGSGPVGVMVYQWDKSVSYAFVGGQSFFPSAPVADLVFEEPAVEQVVGQPQQVIVLALDGAEQPVADVWVHFSVAGTNPTGLTSVNAFSGADGRASFSYTGDSWGLDTVTASIPGVSASGTVKWHSIPVAANQSITVTHDTMYTGAVSGTNADGDDLTYSGTILPLHGELVLQADGSFTYMPDADYAGPDSFVFGASETMATSNGGGMVSITVLPSNLPPVIVDQSLYVPEHSVVGAAVGIVQASDPNGDTLRFAIVDGDPIGVFAIEPATGLIRLVKAEFLDYETMKRTYDLTVEVTDDGEPNLSSQATVSINVTDIDESKTGFTLSNSSVLEHQPVGTVVGQLCASNPDVQSAMMYTLVPGAGNGDNGCFNIVGDQLVATVTFDYEVRESYSIRIRGTDSETVFMELVFPITVLNMNEAPTLFSLSNASVGEDQQVGTLVGLLSATSDIPGDTFSFALASGEGDESNGDFRTNGDRLETASTFSYVPRRQYSIRIGVSNSYGNSVEKMFTIQVTALPEFGKVDGKTKSLAVTDGDGDVVTFKLSGGGLGALQGNQVSLIGTTQKSVLTISVKKGKNGGDGLYNLTGLGTDGLLKGISGSAVKVSGRVQVNILNRTAPKAAMSMKLRQISDADVRVQGLAVSSIAVGGDVSDSRIVTNGSMGKLRAATLLDSEILVGVATNYAGDFVSSAGDFINAAAKLGSLTVSGRKLSSGVSQPAYVMGSHISAPTVGTVTLLNVPADLGPVVHVVNDVGVLKVKRSTTTSTEMIASGTWKVAGARPGIWEVV